MADWRPRLCRALAIAALVAAGLGLALVARELLRLYGPPGDLEPGGR